MYRQSVLLLASVLVLTMKAFAQDAQPEQLSFTSGGRTIGVTAFRPASRTRVPALLVLHGAGGVDAGNRYISQLAAAVAARGYATFLVEYFDRTGTTYASEADARKNYETWLGTLREAVTFIGQQPGVDAMRIGTFGYSLGGYLAIAHASIDDRVRAVVELAGGIDPDFAAKVKRLPPTLIVHGQDDQRVPFARARELESVLQRLGTPAETLFLPGERHLLSPLAALHALDAALKFFEAHLS